MMQVNDFKLLLNGEVFFTAYTPDAPTTFPVNSDDVPELPNGYTFRYGSWIYVVNTMTIYMWNGESFVAQSKAVH